MRWLRVEGATAAEALAPQRPWWRRLPDHGKGVGFVGTIVASGSPDETDHDFIVAVLKKFLSK